MKPSKCSLFKERVSFLGHMVFTEGIDPQEEKIRSIQDWPMPKYVRDVRAFFFLVFYYRKFVQNFASIAALLSALTKKGVRFFFGYLRPRRPSSASSEPSPRRSPWLTHSQTKLSFWTPMHRMSRWAQYSLPRWKE